MKKTTKYLVLPLLILLISGIAHCADISIHFIGYSHLKPVKVRLIIKNDDFKNPKIQYYGHKEQIPLSFLREEELRRNQNGPSLLQQEWEERYNNEKTGRYVMVSQGAVVNHFIYIRYRDMKVFVFDQDPEEW